jgi:YVTN family beta-propeller protein
MSCIQDRASSPAMAARGWLAVFMLCIVGCAAQADTLLVVRKSAGAVDFVDPGSGLTLASVEVGFGPHEISRSPDGRLAAVTNYGTQERPGSTLSIIDLEHPRELRRIELGAWRRPHGVAWYAENRIALTTEEPAALFVIDPSAGRVVSQTATGQPGSHMVSVAPDTSRAYVTNRGGGSTTVVDLANGRKLADVSTGKGSEAIAVTPDGREVWVAAREVGTVTVFDTGTLVVTATLPVPGHPIRIVMTPNGTAIVSCAESSELVTFDARGRREIGRVRIDVPVAASAIERASVGPAGGVVPVGIVTAGDATAYVAATRADKVIALALPALTVLRTMEVPGEPDGMALGTIMPQAVCHACEAPADPYGPDQAD